MSSAAKKIAPMTFSQIEAALDKGKVEMMRPWGDWVPVRRRGATDKSDRNNRRIPVFMERQVEATISTYAAKINFFGIRII